MGTRSGTAERNTAERILDVGERLVQSRGYNAFSYADVAAELDVTKAALHYHYAGKAELGEALLSRYVTRFAERWPLSMPSRQTPRASSSLTPSFISKCCGDKGCAFAACWRPSSKPFPSRCGPL